MEEVAISTPDGVAEPLVLALGARVRRLRRARGLTLAGLASAAGLSHPFLSKIERGLASPSMASLAQIARALGTSQLELLAGSDAGRAPSSPRPRSSGRGRGPPGPTARGRRGCS